MGAQELVDLGELGPGARGPAARRLRGPVELAALAAGGLAGGFDVAPARGGGLGLLRQPDAPGGRGRTTLLELADLGLQAGGAILGEAAQLGLQAGDPRRGAVVAGVGGGVLA